jgi:hypothetical protein
MVLSRVCPIYLLHSEDASNQAKAFMVMMIRFGMFIRKTVHNLNRIHLHSAEGKERKIIRGSAPVEKAHTYSSSISLAIY